MDDAIIKELDQILSSIEQKEETLRKSISDNFKIFSMAFCELGGILKMLEEPEKYRKYFEKLDTLNEINTCFARIMKNITVLTYENKYHVQLKPKI